jgi:hypothetical protein
VQVTRAPQHDADHTFIRALEDEIVTGSLLSWLPNHAFAHTLTATKSHHSYAPRRRAAMARATTRWICLRTDMGCAPPSSYGFAASRARASRS